MRYIRFLVPPYPVALYVCTTDFPILKKVDIDPDLAKHDETNIAETMPAREKRGGAHCVVVRLPDQYDEETVWHESIHASAFVLDIVGSSFNADSMDTVIYQTEYIVSKIKKQFYLIGKKKKPTSEEKCPPSTGE